MLRIYLFGKFCVERKGHIVPGFEARRVQELFCFLLLNRYHAFTRETLASLLWGDCSTAQSKKNLRQVLWRLRSALNAGKEPDTGEVLFVNANRLQINPEAKIWLDVDTFEQIWISEKHAPGKDLDLARAQKLRQAIALHHGPLLEDNYEDWCLLKRERLLNIYIALLEKLMDYSEAEHRCDASIDYGTRILEYDRARESTHRWLMRLYYLLGDRTAALKQYQRCESILREDLGTQPDKQTQMLYQQILADQLDDTSIVGGISMTTHEESAFLSNILGDLKQIQAVQTDLLQRVQHNIQIIERTLKGDMYSLVQIADKLNSSQENKRL